MTNLLNRMHNMVVELKECNSLTYKKEILFEYSDCLPVLEIIYNSFNHFHLTGDSVEKRIDFLEISCEIWNEKELTIIELLKLLIKDNEYSGHKALDLCIGFINANTEYFEIIIKILNKDLKCGISVKTINSVYNNSIPEFNVPKAQTYKSGMCDFANEMWFSSRKLNGLRCLIFIYEDDIKFYTITGNEIYTLNKIKEEMLVEYRGERNIIIDGEICIIDKKGIESFKAIHKEYNKKDHTIEKPKFNAFDIFTIEDFLYCNQSRFEYLYVYEKLMDYFCKPFKYKHIREDYEEESNFKYISVLEQLPIVSINHFNYLRKNTPIHWEGRILRKNIRSQFKRSRFILKDKDWIEAEYIVIGIKQGTKMMGKDEDRKEVTCCGSLTIEHKGGLVQIGSGLSDQQRIDYYNDPESIIGKEITVRYFEEIYDKYGKISLQFATLKAVWSINGKE